jgi:hypothetical protein
MSFKSTENDPRAGEIPKEPPSPKKKIWVTRTVEDGTDFEDALNEVAELGYQVHSIVEYGGSIFIAAFDPIHLMKASQKLMQESMAGLVPQPVPQGMPVPGGG